MKENNKLDVAQAWVQDPAGVSSSTSPIMEEITQFHHYVIVYLTFILFGMSYLVWQRLRSKKIHMELKKEKQKMSNLYKRRLSIVNGTPKTMVIDLPVPSNFRYLWNFGFTLAFVLAVHIVTGIFLFLAMHYCALTTGGVMYMHSYLYGDLLLLLSNITYNSDVAEALHLGFQDPAIMEEIVNFHHYVMVYLTFILFAVAYILVETLRTYNKSNKYIAHKYLIHGTWLEIIWTITPAFILILIAFPSFKLIYLIDEVIDAAITIKVVGHQWYWSYEYSDYADQDGTTIEFDSYMIPESDLEAGDLRLLEVDNQLVVPTNTHVRCILTAADVIHCWAVPSLGVKLDCIPGRLNQTSFLANREGAFYGQCSEICGANHAFMPIVVKAVNLDVWSIIWGPISCAYTCIFQ